jgi:hypothetical protein
MLYLAATSPHPQDARLLEDLVVRGLTVRALDAVSL